MKRISIILSLIFGLTTMISSQETYKLGVNELFEKGIQNSLSIQSSTVKKEIVQSSLGLEKNRRLPDIHVGGTFGYVGKPAILDRSFSGVGHPSTPKWKQNYQVSVTQPLYEGGRIRTNIKRAELEQELAELALSKDKQDLKLWLMGHYLNLFDLYKRKEVLNKNIEEAKVRLHDIEKMKEQGMITNNDVLRSRLLLTNYELSLNETTNDIALVSQQLTIVLGMNEELIIEPDSMLLNDKFLAKSENDYVQMAYNQYPDLKMSKTNISIAETNLKLAKSTLLPTLSLQASNTLARPIPNASPAKDFYLNAWGVSINLSYNISSWFDKKHNVGRAKQQIYLKHLAEEELMQDVRLNVRSASVKHRESQDRIKVLLQSVEQAQENYRIVKNKYYNQLAILTDLLDAEDVLLKSELDLTMAKTSTIYTYYQLQKVSGSL